MVSRGYACSGLTLQMHGPIRWVAKYMDQSSAEFGTEGFGKSEESESKESESAQIIALFITLHSD